MPIENWSDDVVVVHLANDPQFSEELETLEDSRKKSPRDVVLDFSAVRYINSSNISMLLALRKQAQDDDRWLVLCGLSTQLWSTLLVTGLEKVFTFSDNVPTALATIAMEAGGAAEGESKPAAKGKATKPKVKKPAK